MCGLVRGERVDLLIENGTIQRMDAQVDATDRAITVLEGDGQLVLPGLGGRTCACGQNCWACPGTATARPARVSRTLSTTNAG